MNSKELVEYLKVLKLLSQKWMMHFDLRQWIYFYFPVLGGADQ